jgi:REP element-mobilizing transposase RayT
MQTYESLKHTTWDCKYHVVFIPKCRRKVLYQGIRCSAVWRSSGNAAWKRGM